MASLLFLVLLTCESVAATGILVERRPALLRLLADAQVSLPLVTRVAVSLPVAWLPAVLLLAALGKEWLLRDPFLRLKWNGAQLALVFVLIRSYPWAMLAPMLGLVHMMSR